MISGGSGWRRSRLGFGTASLHREFSSQRRLRLLEVALDSGIRHFDTAPAYGDGLGESDLGRSGVLRAAGVAVATKVGLYPALGSCGSASQLWWKRATGRLLPWMSGVRRDWQLARAAESLRASLRRLRRDHVDLLLLHEPDIQLLDADQYLEWVTLEQRAGLLRDWGVAGEPAAVEPFVASGHDLARVVQTRDSLDLHEAGFLAKYGRPLQLTYGYGVRPVQGRDLLPHALARNPEGTVVFSSLSVERIATAGRLCA